MPNSMPRFIAPMMASSVKQPFDSTDWIFETKLDGFRAIAVIDSAGKARLWSRNRLPLEPKFPMVLAAVERLKLRSTILDPCNGYANCWKQPAPESASLRTAALKLKAKLSSRG